MALLMAFLINALMYVLKEEVKLINHYCLPTLMLLYIMLYIVQAYLMLFAALSNAVCLYNAFFIFFLLFFLRTSGRCNRQSEFTLLHFTIFH